MQGRRRPVVLVRRSEAALRLHQSARRRRALREASKLYQLVRTWTKRVGVVLFD
jgi:hypothetical protein